VSQKRHLDQLAGFAQLTAESACTLQ